MRVYSLEVGKPAQAKAASDTKPPEKPPGSRSRSRVAGRRVPWAATVALVLASALGFGTWPRHPAPSLVGRASLAVLPFANLAGDEATGRLADGLAARRHHHRPCALSQHGRHRAQLDRDLQGQGCRSATSRQDLNVRYVLKVRCDGFQIRVTAQLIDSNT